MGKIHIAYNNATYAKTDPSGTIVMATHRQCRFADFNMGGNFTYLIMEQVGNDTEARFVARPHLVDPTQLVKEAQLFWDMVMAGRAYMNSVSQSLTGAFILADGNSYPWGWTLLNEGQGGDAYPDQIIRIPPWNSNGITMKNVSVAGQQTASMITNQVANVNNNFKPGVLNFLLFQEGGNGIYFKGTAALALADVKTYCLNARAQGYKVIVSTLIPRIDINQAQIPLFNAGILADTSFYDGIIRPELNDIFYDYNRGGYNDGGVHPSIAGHLVYRDLYIAEMNRISNN